MSLPYFRYFPGDHLKAKVGMTHDQKGIYTELLEISWEQTPPGTLPNDPAEIARLLGVPLKRFTPQVPIVLRAWKRQGKRLVHDWLQQEYAEKFAKHTERSDAGKKGNEIRWHGSLSDSSAIAQRSHSESDSESDPNPLPLQKEKEGSSPPASKPRKVSPLADAPWLESLKQEKIYEGLNIELQCKKARAWLLANAPQRSFTRRYFGNWLIKALSDKPMTFEPPKKKAVF